MLISRKATSLRLSLTVSLLLVMSPGFSQDLPAGVTPQMIEQVKRLSPAQQQALARQYGITLPTVTESPGTDAGLGDAGTPLTPQVDIAVQSTVNEEEEEDATAVNPSLDRYGEALFNRDVSTFAPTDDAPVPDEYRLGVGDQLIVQFFGKENEVYDLTVGREGDITFPRLGEIAVSGLTFEDARELIQTRIEQQLIGIEAVVSLGRLRAIGIFMAGEVRVPGAYSVSALSTITQALFQAGGVSAIGSLRAIQVRRAGEVVSTFDVYDLLMRGDPTHDIRLQSGDVVFVPTVETVVEIRGEVRRPMAYEMVKGESTTDLLAMAGGFTKDAYQEAVVLIRASVDGALPTAETLVLDDGSSATQGFNNGDTLLVSSVGDRVARSVSIKGAVYRPGIYGWQPGMRVSDLIGSVEEDLLPEVDLNYALIVREKNELLDIAVIQLSLADLIAAPGTDADPELQQGDQLLIFGLPQIESLLDEQLPREKLDNPFSRETLLEPVIQRLQLQARNGEPVLIASVAGAVRAPGDYPILEGYLVSDLVSAAGGLMESAALTNAELRRLRLSIDGRQQSVFTSIRFNRDGRLPDIELQSRDRVMIREVPDWNSSDSIELRGEVIYPGAYVIAPGETLSSVIERAGGLTELASPEGAIFTRRSVAERENQRAAEFSRSIRRDYASRLLTEETTDATLADILAVTEELEAYQGVGRLLVDLPAALAGDLEADYVLEDGDVLTIGQASSTVTVIGEVRQPTTHVFHEDQSVEDYLSLSAGVTQRADLKAVYIVRANGAIDPYQSRDIRRWWRFDIASSAGKLRPGDSIVVPVDSRHKESLVWWRDVTQIVYQGLVSVAAVANIAKD